jgi:hypothetical protein
MEWIWVLVAVVLSLCVSVAAAAGILSLMLSALARRTVPQLR